MMDRLRFRSFASGSSGNCYFIGNASMGILIDAGIGVRTIRRNLKLLGLDFHNIWAIFITHDHTDHIRAVGNIGEKYNVPIYTTKSIHEGINRNYKVTQKLSPASQHFLEIGRTVEIADFQITAFPVSHDATESVGYTVKYHDTTICVATDLGFVSDTVVKHLTNAEHIVVEANYDTEMLKNGRYPDYLKSRIKSETGHLSNTQTADFLSKNFTPRWENIFLCHLSKDNNTPEKAKETIQNRLTDDKKNIENLTITALNRGIASPLFIFEQKEKEICLKN